MALAEPEPGLVISYAYLWRDEARAGREEGVKDRPCVIVLMVQTLEGAKVVTVAPISHSPPQDASEAIELPPKTKRRLHLDEERSWVVTTEINQFIWPGPDLRPVSRERPNEFVHGALPKALTAQIIERILLHYRNRSLGIVKRSD